MIARAERAAPHRRRPRSKTATCPTSSTRVARMAHGDLLVIPYGVADSPDQLRDREHRGALDGDDAERASDDRGEGSPPT